MRIWIKEVWLGLFFLSGFISWILNRKQHQCIYSYSNNSFDIDDKYYEDSKQGNKNITVVFHDKKLYCFEYSKYISNTVTFIK